jgi:hypothetical protein
MGEYWSPNCIASIGSFVVGIHRLPAYLVEFKTGILSLKTVGYIVLQVAIYLVLVGGIGDVVMTRAIGGIPQTHMNYLGLDKINVSAQLQGLDSALIRAVGGLLIAIALGSLAILYGQIKKGIYSGLLAIILMITVGEGNNAMQMAFINSPYFVYPLLCIALSWVGAILWWVGHDKTPGR